MQRLLKTLAQLDPARFGQVDPDAVDGVLGPNTRTAIEAYRRLVDLPDEEWLVTEALWNSLLTTHMSLTLDPTGRFPRAVDNLDPTGGLLPPAPPSDARQKQPVRTVYRQSLIDPFAPLGSDSVAPAAGGDEAQSPAAAYSQPSEKVARMAPSDQLNPPKQLAEADKLAPQDASRSSSNGFLQSPSLAAPASVNPNDSLRASPPKSAALNGGSASQAAGAGKLGSGPHEQPDTTLFWAVVAAASGLVLVTLLVLAVVRRRSTMIAAVPGAGVVAFDLEPEVETAAPPESDYARLLREFDGEDMRLRRKLRDEFLSRYIEPGCLPPSATPDDSRARWATSRETSGAALQVGLGLKQLLEKDPETYREIFLTLMFLDSVGRAIREEKVPETRLDPRINREIDLLRRYFTIHLLELNDRRDIGSRMPGLFHFLNTPR